MDKVIQRYIFHLDNLRMDYKMTVNDFCEGIVNPRTYRYYLEGKKNISHMKIIKFCDRLSISPTDFFYSVTERDREELRKIKKLYKVIMNRQYDRFQPILEEVKERNIISKQNRRFLEYCIIKYRFNTHKENSKVILNQIMSLLNYPDCCERNAFDFVDICGLQLIADIEMSCGDHKATNKLVQILESDEMKYINSESHDVLPAIYANTSLFLCRDEDYERSESLARKGLKYSLKYSDLSGLAHLYYVLSYSLLQLGRKDEGMVCAMKCIMTSSIKENSFEYEMFKRDLSTEFDCDIIEMIPKYKQELN